MRQALATSRPAAGMLPWLVRKPPNNSMRATARRASTPAPALAARGRGQHAHTVAHAPFSEPCHVWPLRARTHQPHGALASDRARKSPSLRARARARAHALVISIGCCSALRPALQICNIRSRINRAPVTRCRDVAPQLFAAVAIQGATATPGVPHGKCSASHNCPKNSFQRPGAAGLTCGAAYRECAR